MGAHGTVPSSGILCVTVAASYMNSTVAATGMEKMKMLRVYRKPELNNVPWTPMIMVEQSIYNWTAFISSQIYDNLAKQGEYENLLISNFDCILY